jgi:hypothetical protein
LIKAFWAKAEGKKVTAETCPQYLTLTAEALKKLGPYAKMNPPLRSERDIEELYQRLPEQVKAELDKLKYITYAKSAERGTITEEDQKKIMEHIDELFKKDDERPF